LTTGGSQSSGGSTGSASMGTAVDSATGGNAGTGGASPVVCASGLTNCDNQCVDLRTSIFNCGACGNACPLSGPSSCGGLVPICEYTQSGSYACACS
jgi:hypothetical protein